MKITEVRIYLTHTGRLHPVVIEVLTDEGITGVGEAGVAYGLGQTAACGMGKDIAERLLIGKDPSRIEALWSEMYDHSFCCLLSTSAAADELPPLPNNGGTLKTKNNGT